MSLFENLLHILSFNPYFRQKGAVVVDNLKLDNFAEIFKDDSETVATEAEFKIALNAYLKDLVASPVRSLADVIAFNNKHPNLVSSQYLCYISTVWIKEKGKKNWGLTISLSLVFKNQPSISFHFFIANL